MLNIAVVVFYSLETFFFSSPLNKVTLSLFIVMMVVWIIAKRVPDQALEAPAAVDKKSD